MNHEKPVRFPDGSFVPEIANVVKLKVPHTIDNTKIVANAHRRWTAADARRLRCASPSDFVVLYCAKGEHFDSEAKWANRNSHKRISGGGTNVIFGDTHVEWVKGTEIKGW